jgi:hypothetical protein
MLEYRNGLGKTFELQNLCHTKGGIQMLAGNILNQQVYRSVSSIYGSVMLRESDEGNSVGELKAFLLMLLRKRIAQDCPTKCSQLPSVWRDLGRVFTFLPKLGRLAIAYFRDRETTPPSYGNDS